MKATPVDVFCIKKKFMESVRDKRTCKIVDAENLWLLNGVNTEGYVC